MQDYSSKVKPQVIDTIERKPHNTWLYCLHWAYKFTKDPHKQLFGGGRKKQEKQETAEL